MSEIKLAPVPPMIIDFRAYEAAPGISVIVLTDCPVYTRVAVSNDFIRATGMRREDVINKGLFDVFPKNPGGRDSGCDQNLRASFEHILLNKEPHEISTQRYDTADGNGSYTPKYWKINNAPILNDNGDVLYIVHSAVDITEKVNADQNAEQLFALRKVEEIIQQVRTLVESVPFPIGVYIGQEMRIEFANKSIIDAWGKGNQVIGKLYTEILPELDNQEIFSQLAGVFNTGIPFHAKHQRVDLEVNGKMQTYFFNYSFTPLYNAENKVYGVMNTAAEVTDLVVAKQQVEQSAKNFRSMILQAPVAMCILLGPSHIIDVANEFMIGLWGKTAGDVMHKPIFEALPDSREQGLEKLLADVYQTGVTFKANERPVTLVRRGKHETVYQNFVYEPYKDVEGNILGVLTISIDVTEQVLARHKIEETVVKRTSELADANDALLKSNRELIRSNNSLEEFTHAASHDLKEPIRKIQIFTQRLKDSLGKKISETENQYCSRIELASNRMGTLIDDLLTYSEVSERSALGESIDMNQLINLVLNDLDLEIEEKRAIIQVGKLPSVKGHHRQLQQAMYNLISNALKYSKSGIVPVVEIASSTIMGGDAKGPLSEADQVKIFHLLLIRDNGIGFDPDYAEHIFKMFTRLHASRDYKGTGIGLSIVRKVIENHKGHIWAECNPGVGATFKVLLPAD